MPKLNDKGAPVLYQAADCGGSSARAQAVQFSFGTLVADEEEFAHFEECMNAPTRPSEKLLAGAKLLQKFPRR